MFSVSNSKKEKENEIIRKFSKGEFDHIVFSDKPKLTEELKIVIKKDNRFFAQRLLAKCDQEKIFLFWLTKGVKLPKDSVFLALKFKSKRFIFDYLYHHKFFDKMTDSDKRTFLQHARSKFTADDFLHLKTLLKIDINQGKQISKRIR